MGSSLLHIYVRTFLCCSHHSHVVSLFRCDTLEDFCLTCLDSWAAKIVHLIGRLWLELIPQRYCTFSSKFFYEGLLVPDIVWAHFYFIVANLIFYSTVRHNHWLFPKNRTICNHRIREINISLQKPSPYFLVCIQILKNSVFYLDITKLVLKMSFEVIKV